jgi:hypothetical protein
MHEFSSGSPTIKEFRKQFENIASEATMDGEHVNSHPTFISKVSARDEDGNTYDILGLDIDFHPGCGCWEGVEIVVRKQQD